MVITIGQKIKKKRQDLGLTQDELARKAMIPYTTLVKIEADIVTDPRTKTLQKIAKALNILIDDLLN